MARPDYGRDIDNQVIVDVDGIRLLDEDLDHIVSGDPEQLLGPTGRLLSRDLPHATLIGAPTACFAECCGVAATTKTTGTSSGSCTATDGIARNPGRSDVERHQLPSGCDAVRGDDACLALHGRRESQLRRPVYWPDRRGTSCVCCAAGFHQLFVELCNGAAPGPGVAGRSRSVDFGGFGGGSDRGWSVELAAA